MKHTIKETAELLGVTTHNLRYYEKMNLIKPETNEENGYRYYSILDTRRFNLIRYYRSMGLSIEEINSILINKEQFNENALLERINNEIIVNYMTLDSIKEHSNLVNYMHENFNQISVIERRPSIRVEFAKGDVLTKDKNLIQLRDTLLKYPSISRWVSRIDTESLLNNEEFNFYYGLNMDLNSAVSLGIDISKYEIILKSKYILGFYKKDNRFKYTLDDFKFFRDYINNNLIKVGNIFVSTVSSDGDSEDYCIYNLIIAEILE